MRNWYNVKAQADTAVEVSIYDEIGGWGVTAKDFIDSIRPHKGKVLNLSINSPGGDVFAGIAIYNALRMHGADVNVRIMGVAASAASLIAMAGTTITMPENTFLMVHNPWTFAMGNADELRDMADVLDKISSSLVGTYVARTGKSEDEIKQMLADETWLTATEAVEAGFADEVEAILKVAALFDLDRLPENIRTAISPVAEVVPEVIPEPASREPTVTLAARIVSAAEARGLSEFVAAWVLDSTIETVEQLEPRLDAAEQIVATCGFAKRPELAAGYITANAALRDVRIALCDMRAQADEQSVIDTAPRSKTAALLQSKTEFGYRDAYRTLNTKKG